MSTVKLKAINDAPFIQVQNITIARTFIDVELTVLTQNSLNVLVQEFEERRLESDDISALFLAAGQILNDAGTGSAGEINSGGGGGSGWTGTDDTLRVEIGNRTTNYNQIFLNYLNQ